jgi:capsule polysaccharide export protein KpsE/RkpR
MSDSPPPETDAEFSERVEADNSPAAKRIEELEAELAEWRDAAKHVDSDHPGEVHCGCVAILRKQLADARLSLKHAMEAECLECALRAQEKETAK